jgi:hypothetical protein
MSEVPARTVTLPSCSSRTIAYEAPVVADDLMPTARPRPRPSGAGAPQPIQSAAARTACAQSPSAGVSPAPRTISSPRAARFFSRSSTGSMPSCRAAASICDSKAQAICGLPKPRSAVAGGVWVRMARTEMRAWGVRYGPQAR